MGNHLSLAIYLLCHVLPFCYMTMFTIWYTVGQVHVSIVYSVSPTYANNRPSRLIYHSPSVRPQVIVLLHVCVLLAWLMITVRDVHRTQHQVSPGKIDHWYASLLKQDQRIDWLHWLSAQRWGACLLMLAAVRRLFNSPWGAILHLSPTETVPISFFFGGGRVYCSGRWLCCVTTN